MIEITYTHSKLYPCQECYSYGDIWESGKWYTCGWCNGVGEVDGSTRARWLNYKKAERNNKSVY